MTDELSAVMCPACGYVLSAATAVDGSDFSPKPGDVSVCLMCGQPLVFDDQLRVRRPRPGELPPDVVARLDQAAALAEHFRRDNPELL